MEAIMSETTQEGHQPKSPVEVLSQVLPKSSTFLQNVGLNPMNKTRSGGAFTLQVQDLQAQLESEKQESAGLRQEVDTLKRHVEESEAKSANQSIEMELLKKNQQETHALLRQLLTFNNGHVNPSSNS